MNTGMPEHSTISRAEDNGPSSPKGRPEVVGSIRALRALATEARGRGERVVFVPTMGALHEGHLSLVRAARQEAGDGGLVVVSIFVNPTQFAPGEDLERYPQPVDEDLRQCGEAGVDLIFMPPAAEMYPKDYSTFVEVAGISDILCGGFRSGHFKGVATVVLKLLLACSPDVAIFGRKDYQQLQVIRRMVTDMGLDLEIIGMPTSRDSDGLALSSRNVYLSADGRSRAARISRGLGLADSLYRSGERRVDVLLAAARGVMMGGGEDQDGDGEQAGVQIQYLELRMADSMGAVDGTLGDGEPVVMLVAAFVEGVRLIDNQELGFDPAIRPV